VRIEALRAQKAEVLTGCIIATQCIGSGNGASDLDDAQRRHAAARGVVPRRVALGDICTQVRRDLVRVHAQQWLGRHGASLLFAALIVVVGELALVSVRHRAARISRAQKQRRQLARHAILAPVERQTRVATAEIQERRLFERVVKRHWLSSVRLAAQFLSEKRRAKHSRMAHKQVVGGPKKKKNNLSRAATTTADVEHIVQQFVHLPNAIDINVLSPLSGWLGGLPPVVTQLFGELTAASRVLRTTQVVVGALTIVGAGAVGSGKSTMLNHMAGACVLPALGGGASITQVCLRLIHAVPEDASVLAGGSSRVFRLRLRVPTVEHIVELASDAPAPAQNGSTYEDVVNPFRDVDTPEALARRAASGDIGPVFEALRSAVDALGDERLAVDVRARNALVALEGVLARPPARSIADNDGGLLTHDISSHASVSLGEYCGESADRAVQRMIELVGALLPACLVYVFDISCSSFRFPPAFQLVDIPGIGVNNRGASWRIAQRFARDASTSWLVMPVAARRVDVVTMGKVFDALMPNSGQLAAAPPILTPTYIKHASEREQANQDAERVIASALGKFNANLAMARGRARSSGVGADETVGANFTKLAIGSVRTFDQLPFRGNFEALPDAEAMLAAVYGDIRWLKARGQLSTMHMKLVNLSAMVRVLIKTRKVAVASNVAGKAAAPLSRLRLFLEKKCAPLGNIVSELFIRHAKREATQMYRLVLAEGVTAAEQRECLNDMCANVVVAATQFWNCTETELVVRNLSRFLRAPDIKKFEFDFALDDRRDNDSDDDNVGDSSVNDDVDAIHSLARTHCRQLELAIPDIGPVLAERGEDASDDDDYVDDVSDDAALTSGRDDDDDGGDDDDDDSDDDDGDGDGDASSRGESCEAHEVVDAALFFRAAEFVAEDCAEQMSSHVRSLGKVLSDLVGEGKPTIVRRTDMPVHLEASLKAALDKPLKDLSTHALQERTWATGVTKQLAHHLDLLPPRPTREAISQVLVGALRSGGVRDEEHTTGAIVHSRLAADNDDSALPVVLLTEVAPEERKFPLAVIECMADISARAAVPIRAFVSCLAGIVESDTIVRQRRAFVANDETPLWVPPVFVPIDKAAIDARQGALWHMKTNGTDERSLCHLTVLVMISCPEWREIAFQALQYVGDDRQVVVLVLPPSHRGEPLPLHPAAEEFALAFTRDVLSQQIGAYVDFCIMPSTLLDFGELNLAMNKVRAVSTGLALHYVEQVLSDLRAKAHERLVAIQNAKKGTDDYKRRTALRVELTSLDAAPLSTVERLPECADLIGKAEWLLEPDQPCSAISLLMETLTGSVLSCVRLLGHLRSVASAFRRNVASLARCIRPCSQKQTSDYKRAASCSTLASSVQNAPT
jgi:hypothetical protein